MKHVYALLVKFAVITIVLEIILGFLTNLNFLQILYVALTVTLIAYIVSDLLILPVYNTTIGTLSDALFTVFIIYIYNFIWTGTIITLTTALIAGACVGLVEWFFYKYAAKHVFPNRHSRKI